MSQLLSGKDEQLRQARVRELWTLWSRHEAKANNASVIKVSRLTLVTDPARQSENPLRSELLCEIRLSDLRQLSRKQ